MHQINSPFNPGRKVGGGKCIRTIEVLVKLRTKRYSDTWPGHPLKPWSHRASEIRHEARKDGKKKQTTSKLKYLYIKTMDKAAEMNSRKVDKTHRMTVREEGVCRVD